MKNYHSPNSMNIGRTSYRTVAILGCAFIHLLGCSDSGIVGPEPSTNLPVSVEWTVCTADEPAVDVPWEMQLKFHEWQEIDLNQLGAQDSFLTQVKSTVIENVVLVEEKIGHVVRIGPADRSNLDVLVDLKIDGYSVKEALIELSARVNCSLLWGQFNNIYVTYPVHVKNPEPGDIAILHSHSITLDLRQVSARDALLAILDQLPKSTYYIYENYINEFSPAEKRYGSKVVVVIPEAASDNPYTEVVRTSIGRRAVTSQGEPHPDCRKDSGDYVVPGVIACNPDGPKTPGTVPIN